MLPKVYQIRISSAVKLDLIDLVQFYENQEAGLGNKFIDDYESTIARLQQSPNSYFFVSDLLRRIPFSKFQCSIIYSINNNDTIEIVMVKDMRSKPLKDFY
ncbi:MAG: type II toxin-antitoxin system RelE/ParE family toxin [Bacteroidota bacterium]|nr:type II toxin-antitoxin system RelE/ParE family toxin [Bacteroidota bacterium]